MDYQDASLADRDGEARRHPRFMGASVFGPEDNGHGPVGHISPQSL